MTDAAEPRLRASAGADSLGSPSRPTLLPLRLLIGCERAGTSGSSLLPFEPVARGQNDLRFRQDFQELNVSFAGGRIRAAAGDKTCPSYWACPGLLRNPQKFRNIHPFSKVWVATTRRGKGRVPSAVKRDEGEGTREMREEGRADQHKMNLKRVTDASERERRKWEKQSGRGTGESIKHLGLFFPDNQTIEGFFFFCKQEGCHPHHRK